MKHPEHVVRAGIAVALLALMSLAGVGTAGATKPPEHLVTICHATPPDTAAQGWVQITVDVASVGYQQSGHQSEHDADIIPPWSYGDFDYPGKGDQAILENGCEPVDPPTCEELENCPPVPCEETETCLPEHTCEQLGTCPADPPVADPPVADPPAATPTLPATGSALLRTGLVGSALLALGLVLWSKAKTRARALGFGR
jgi:hypothetical protein